MIIRQSTRELELCAEWERQVLDHLPNRANYTGAEASRRYYIGYRGELAVCRFFSSQRIYCEHEVHTDGTSQPSEVTLQFGGRPVRVEVKTRGQRKHTGALWPKAQDHRWDLLIACHLVDGIDGERCAVRGWIGRKDINTLRVETRHLEGGPRHFVPWPKLRPMFRLPQLVQRLQTTEEWLEDYGEVDGTAAV